VVYGIEPMVILKDMRRERSRDGGGSRWMMDALVDTTLREQR
jgi:hypothetical protein